MNETSNRAGDWMQTYTGRQFWPLDPCAEEVAIVDIAHALSLQCRFAGHCRVFYSVAEHCVRVSDLAIGMRRSSGLLSRAWWRTCMWLGRDVEVPEAKRQGGRKNLLHDATEAFVVDVPRPLKRTPEMAPYRTIEARVARVIERWCDLPPCATEDADVKHADEVLLATEARDIMGGQSAGKWSLRAEPLPDRIVPWSPAVAERAFLLRFAALSGRP